MADEVLTSRDGAVLTITLNRPDVYNAVNRAMHEGLASALGDAADPEVRAVVLTGAGRGFCSGQDLREFESLPGGVSRSARADVPPERPRDPRAREARDRGHQRAGRGRGALARVLVRRPRRVRRRELRARLHRDRSRPRRRRHVVHPPAARVLARVRVDGLESTSGGGGGARPGGSSPRASRPRASRSESPSSPRGTRRCRRARSR